MNIFNHPILNALNLMEFQLEPLNFDEDQIFVNRKVAKI